MVDPREHIYTQEFGSITDEAKQLRTFLEFHQDALLRKLEGLTDEQVRHKGVDSGLSLLGLVHHNAYVHHSWFQLAFADGDMELPWPAESWSPDPDREHLISMYKAEVQRSRDIMYSAALDDLNRGWTKGDPARNRPGYFTMRWIQLHMLEELARHNGHADILREQIDGATGE